MKNPKVLVACEESQRVCTAFRERGIEAYSCDIIEPSGGHPEWHIQGDVIPVLRGGTVTTMDGQEHEIGKWSLVIAHPPCTYLTVTGNKWFDRAKYGDAAKQREKDRFKAIVFFMRCVYANSDHVAVENPIGIMGTAYQKATQIIQPYEYGETSRKATCLWLQGLPELKPTKIVEPKLVSYDAKDGRKLIFSEDYSKGGKDRQKNRSKTFPGIAKAMADQWGDYILSLEDE